MTLCLTRYALRVHRPGRAPPTPTPPRLQPVPFDDVLDGVDRNEADGSNEDPVLSATRDYLTDLKAPLYAQLSAKAQEVAAITSVKPVRPYAADGELELYTPACLAQR